MALEIPKEDTGSIVAISALSASSFDKVVTALKSVGPFSRPADMADHVASQVPSIPNDRLRALLDTLYTLYHIRELSGVPYPRFLDDLVDGIRENPNLPLTPDEIAKLRKSLDILLGIETIGTVAKAAGLQRDGERLYCEAKILSDIRPVFGDDVSKAPMGAVITHTLRIGYHEGSQHKEFHVVLDSEDLKALHEAVTRAQGKDSSMALLLEKFDLPNLGD